MTNLRHDYPEIPPRPPYRPRGRTQRILQYLDETAPEPAGRIVEWILVVVAIICLIAVIAIASRSIDGDLDTSAKVSEEQHQRVEAAKAAK